MGSGFCVNGKKTNKIIGCHLVDAFAVVLSSFNSKQLNSCPKVLFGLIVRIRLHVSVLNSEEPNLQTLHISVATKEGFPADQNASLYCTSCRMERGMVIRKKKHTFRGAQGHGEDMITPERASLSETGVEAGRKCWVLPPPSFEGHSIFYCMFSRTW